MGRLIIVGVLFWTALGGCSVSPPGPRDRPFRCGTDADCLDGFDCVDRSMLGLPGFCAPSCDPARSTATCPLGLCTPDGACLSRCLPERDGTVRVSCPSGLTCVRTDLFRDEGVCWDITGCSTGGECDEEDVASACLSEVLGVPALIAGLPIATNRLYCVPTPTGPLHDRCAVGTIPLSPRGDFPGACLPTCNDRGDTCPPSMSCWRDLGWFFGAVRQSVCWVGEWGALCESDADCLLGRCLDVGDRKVCTERCDDVPIGDSSCEPLSATSLYAPGGNEFTCRSVGSESVCVPRGRVGAPCGADRPCLDSLRCFTLSNESTGLCSVPCTRDTDCFVDEVPEPRRSEVYCDFVNQACLPQRGPGSSCSSAHECLSGLCIADLCTNVAE